MTREEAIKVLSSYDVNGVWADVDGKPYNAEEQAEAFDMALEALKQDAGKLNNPDDSLLTADSEACKEQKSKLESEKVQLSPKTSTNKVDTSTDIISRQAAIDALQGRK